MSNEFKWFRDSDTGKTAKYPESFAGLFPTLEEIDSSDVHCVDCTVDTVPPAEDTQPDLVEYEVFDDETEDDD